MGCDLLQSVPFEHAVKETGRGPVYPEMVEVAVNDELAPILVSSTRGVLWVNRVTGSGTVRAAVRSRTGLEADLVSAVAELGSALKWGNVQPLSSSGIAQLASHIRSYGLEDLEALHSPALRTGDLDFCGLPQVEAGWVPIDVVVVVPRDRSFVGSLGVLGSDRAFAVVHNASRGVGVAWNDDVARIGDESVVAVGDSTVTASGRGGELPDG